MASYLVVGPPRNWGIGLEHHVWGLPSSGKHMWGRVLQGDTILFYVTAPVRGVVGYGHASSTRIEQSPVWPEEVGSGYAIWPYRIKLEIAEVLTRDRWEDHRCKTGGLYVNKSIQVLSDRKATELTEAVRNAVEGSGQAR